MHPRLCAVIVLAATAAALVLQLPADALLGGQACTIEGNAGDPPTFRNCVQCHDDSPANSGDGFARIDGVPSRYLPGANYTLTVVTADPGQARWGVRFAALDEAGDDLGTLAPADANSVPCIFDGKQYLRHSSTGVRAGFPDGPVDFAVSWTAPPAGSGPARFYAATLPGDNDNDETGDFTYLMTGATVEDAPGFPELTLTMQPDDPQAHAGTTWTVRARVRNHSDVPLSPFVAARVRLPNGKLVPSSGFLEPPVQVHVAPGEQAEVVWTHAVPANVPAIRPRYQGFIGFAPSTVAGRFDFKFELVP